MISELFQVSMHYWTWLDDKKAVHEPHISYTDIHKMASMTFTQLQAAATKQTIFIKEAASNQKLIINFQDIILYLWHQVLVHYYWTAGYIHWLDSAALLSADICAAHLPYPAKTLISFHSTLLLWLTLPS